MARRPTGGVFVHVDVFTKDVDAALRQIEIALSPVSLVRFHELFTLQIMRERFSSRFEKEGDPDPWQPLTESRGDIREHAGFWRDHPINTETGELRNWIEKNRGRSTPNALGASWSFPGAAPRRPSVKEKYRTMQAGKPAGFPMPDGIGGSKASPSPTPARPVVGLDALDMAHVLAALELFVVAEMAKFG